MSAIVFFDLVTLSSQAPLVTPPRRGRHLKQGPPRQIGDLRSERRVPRDFGDDGCPAFVFCDVFLPTAQCSLTDAVDFGARWRHSVIEYLKP